MKIAEIKKVKDQRPFQPFLIRMADGREILVRHPDAIAWDIDPDEERANGEPPEPFAAHCVLPGGGWAVIELALVTSLGPAPPPPAPQNPKGRPRRRPRR
jgi:hypothetical protein